MKLLLDQGLPRRAIPKLLQCGFDAVHTGDIQMATATDHEIVEYARREARVIITLDADFHALLVLSNATSPSIVRVRIEGLRGEQIAELVQRVIVLCEVDLRSGALITVEEHRVRVRTLPLIR